MNSLYLKGAIWDYLFVLAASIALCYTLLHCFYVDPGLQYTPIPAVVCAVVLLALFIVAANRTTLRIGIPVFGVVLLVSWIVSAALVPDGGVFADTEQNYLIFVMCTTLTPLACFLLSRKLVGAALLFIGGSFVIGLVQFLYERFELAWAFVFVAAALAGIVYRNYQMSLRSASSVKTVSFFPGFAVSAGMCAVAVGLGCAVFFGIIAPLNPPAAEIKLITEYRALETVRVKGIADIVQVPNIDMTSDTTNDDERTTDDIKESASGREYPATGKSQQENPDDANTPPGSSAAGINLDVPEEMFDFINYLTQFVPFFLLGLVALVVAYFVGRRMRRRNRLKRLMGKTPNDVVKSLYPFFVKEFSKAGILNMAPGQTLNDFTVANAATMAQFDEAAGVPFSALTADYSAVTYGNAVAGTDASARFADYYNAFWKAARRKLGPAKYFFKSFRL